MPNAPTNQVLSDTGWVDWPADPTELLLSALRSAVLRAKLDANEVTTIGIALRAGMISPDLAVAWLADAGLIDQVIADEVAP